MDIWEILELEPTNDVRKIKRAYAKKLKVTHPDDDLEAFQTLKEAFDIALNYAKNNTFSENQDMDKSYEESSEHSAEDADRSYDENSEHSTEDTDKPYEKNSEHNIEDFNKSLDEKIHESEDYIYEEDVKNQDEFNTENNIYETKQDEGSESLDEGYNYEFPMYNEEASHLSFTYFTEEVNRVYNDFDLRIDILRWKSILNSNVTWNMVDFNKYEDFLINFIVKKHKFIPYYVINLIVEYFSIDTSFLEKYNFLDKSISKKYLKQIFNPPALSFSSLSKLGNEEKEKFLDYRYDSYINIINGNYISARMKIIRGKKVFKNDPDLILLETFIVLKAHKYSVIKHKSFRKKKYLKSSVEINRAIELDRNNPTARLFRLSLMDALSLDIIESDISIAEKGDTYLLSKEYVLGNAYNKLKEYRKSYDHLISLKDDRRSYTRRRIVKSIRGLKRKWKADLKKNPADEDIKNNIRALKEQLQLFSKIAFLKTYFKKVNSVVFFIITTILLLTIFATTEVPDKNILGDKNIYVISEKRDLKNAYSNSNRVKLSLNSKSLVLDHKDKEESDEEPFYLEYEGFQYLVTTVKDNIDNKDYAVIVALKGDYKTYKNKDFSFIGEVKEIKSVPNKVIDDISKSVNTPISTYYIDNAISDEDYEVSSEDKYIGGDSGDEKEDETGVRVVFTIIYLIVQYIFLNVSFEGNYRNDKKYI